MPVTVAPGPDHTDIKAQQFLGTVFRFLDEGF